MTTLDATLAEVRDQLKEARRYTREYLPSCRVRILEALRGMDKWIRCNRGIQPDSRIGQIEASSRNLTIGLEYIQADPAVLEGYIDGAVFELSLGKRGGE